MLIAGCTPNAALIHDGIPHTQDGNDTSYVEILVFVISFVWNELNYCY